MVALRVYRMVHRNQFTIERFLLLGEFVIGGPPVSLVQVFVGDGGEVRKQLEKYTVRMDRMVEEALRLNVKWSLQEMHRAIFSDGKSPLNPLFKVKVILTSQVISDLCATSNTVEPLYKDTPELRKPP